MGGEDPPLKTAPSQSPWRPCFDKKHLEVSANFALTRSDQNAPLKTSYYLATSHRASHLTFRCSAQPRPVLTVLEVPASSSVISTATDRFIILRDSLHKDARRRRRSSRTSPSQTLEPQIWALQPGPRRQKRHTQPSSSPRSIFAANCTLKSNHFHIHTNDVTQRDIHSSVIGQLYLNHGPRQGWSQGRRTKQTWFRKRQPQSAIGHVSVFLVEEARFFVSMCLSVMV